MSVSHSVCIWKRRRMSRTNVQLLVCGQGELKEMNMSRRLIDDEPPSKLGRSKPEGELGRLTQLELCMNSEKQIKHARDSGKLIGVADLMTMSIKSSVLALTKATVPRGPNRV